MYNTTVPTAALGIACLLVTTSPFAASTRKAIDGCYTQSFNVRMSAYPQDKIATATNYLGLKKNRDGEYEFAIDLTGDNDHRCGATGIARVVSSGKITILHMQPERAEESESAESASCKLSFTISSNFIEVDQIEGSCSQHFFCGQGMEFFRIAFPLTSKRIVATDADSCISSH